MGQRILVVDDDEVLLSFLDAQLEARGFEVTTSISAQQGLEELVMASRNGSSFDLLITDLDMPGHRGTALIRAVRDLEDKGGVAKEEQLPTLLLSATDWSTLADEERDDLMGLGISYLRKEHTSERLITIVRRMLAL